MDATTSHSDFVQGSSARRVSVGVVITRLPIFIRYALLRKPTKGPDCNGMYRLLSTEPLPIRTVHNASSDGLNTWGPQTPSSNSHSRSGTGPGAHGPHLQRSRTLSPRFLTAMRSLLREPASSV